MGAHHPSYKASPPGSSDSDTDQGNSSSQSWSIATPSIASESQENDSLSNPARTPGLKHKLKPPWRSRSRNSSRRSSGERQKSAKQEEQQQQQQQQQQEQQQQQQQQQEQQQHLDDNIVNHHSILGIVNFSSTGTNTQNSASHISRSEMNKKKDGNGSKANSARRESFKSPFSMLRGEEETVRVPPLELTDQQKTLLRASWSQLSGDISQVGIIAFIGLFETHPDVRDTFLPFRGLSTTDIESSAILRAHALRVMTTVEKCLNRLDSPDKMHAVVEQLGARHVAYSVKTEYIQVVGTQFVSALRSHVMHWTPEMEEAWMSMVRIISFYMHKGVLDKMESTDI